jgi:hypothetical protein
VYPSTSARRAPGREDEERRRKTGEDVFREHDRRSIAHHALGGACGSGKRATPANGDSLPKL